MPGRWGIRWPTPPLWLTSNEGVLGALAVNDLFWRTFADVPWQRLPEVISVLAGSAFVSFLVSALASQTGLFRLVGLLAQWLLIGFLVFTATPRIYIWTTTDITQDARFRLLTTGVSVGLALSLFPPLTLSSNHWLFYLAALGVVLLGGVFFWMYFDRVHDWNRLDPNERVDLLNAFFPVPDSDRRDLVDGFTAGGVHTHAAVVVWKIALVLLCVIPCLLLGIFIDFALSLYPLLELAVLTGIAVDRWSGRLPEWLRSDQLTTLESRLYDSVAYAGRGMKGMALMILVMIGFLLPVLLFAGVFPLWVKQVTFWLRMLFAPGPFFTTPTIGLTLWNQTGVFLCFFFSVGLQLWFWFRMLDRLPHFLDHWERRHNVRAAYATDEERIEDSSPTSNTSPPSQPLTRPVGCLIPAVLALVPAIVFIYLNPYPVSDPLHRRLHYLFAFAWPIVVAILMGSVWMTATRDSQPIWTDAYAFPLSLMIQAGVIAALTTISRTPEPGSLRVGAVWLAPGSFTAFVLVVIPWAFFFEDVGLYARRHRGPWQYADVAYLLSFGGITYLISNFASSSAAVLFFMLAVACFVGSIALGLAKYFY